MVCKDCGRVLSNDVSLERCWIVVKSSAHPSLIHGQKDVYGCTGRTVRRQGQSILMSVLEFIPGLTGHQDVIETIRTWIR